MAFDSTYETTYAASNFKARVQDHAELKSARDDLAFSLTRLRLAAAGCEDKDAQQCAMNAAAAIEAAIHDELDHGALFVLHSALDKLKTDYPDTLDGEQLPEIKPITAEVRKLDPKVWGDLDPAAGEGEI